MVTKTVVEETREICGWCRGLGQQSAKGETSTTVVACFHCAGAGTVLTKTVTRRENVDVDDLVAEVSDRLLGKLRAQGVAGEKS